MMASAAIEVDITVTRTFKEALLELCEEYDRITGYSECPDEGAALYRFYLNWVKDIEKEKVEE